MIEKKKTRDSNGKGNMRKVEKKTYMLLKQIEI
jgi:hypothetical protein